MGLRMSKFNNSNISSINDPYKHVNMIAASLITNSHFKDKLLSKAHCDELIIITESIFKKYFTVNQIQYINQEISDKPINKNVYLLETNYINKLDERNPDTKEKMCKSISSFYIKIAHIFSAIFCTLNPDLDNFRYTVKENKKKYSLSKEKTNFCTKRITNMKKAYTNIDAPASQTICQPLEHGNNSIKHKYLEEFVKLYPKSNTLDKSNIKRQGANQFIKRMTDCKNEGKKVTYNENEKTNRETNFESIKFKDYCSKIRCEGLTRLNVCFKKEQKTLDIEYKNHLILTEKRYKKNQAILLGYIDKLFVKEKTEYIISPYLNHKTVDEMMTNLRKDIAQCYFDCEEDYQKGLLLYKAKIELNKLTTKCNKEFISTTSRSENIKNDIAKIKNDKLQLEEDNNLYERDTNKLNREMDTRESDLYKSREYDYNKYVPREHYYSKRDHYYPDRDNHYRNRENYYRDRENYYRYK
tara:strand:+ start:2593 stop:4002 length:1410 start_codon:yes stop_codon:yes gene_type:complete